MKFFFLFLVVLFTGNVTAQRTQTGINQDWQFKRSNGMIADEWKPVSLPHTWNKEDVMDDEPGYYRGIGTYKRIITIDRKKKTGRQYYLLFEAANQVANVWVNGKKAAEHKGGYTAFYVPITTFLKDGDNEIMVTVDNSHDTDIPPLSADFTFYGGLYRDAKLITTKSVHFSFSDQTAGIRISTPVVDSGKAVAEIKTRLSNESADPRKVVLEQKLIDRRGNLVQKANAFISLIPQQADHEVVSILNITKPQLWSPEHPYLYNLITSVRDRQTGELLDEIKQPVGFRWFRFDVNEGFILNGKPLKLIGVSRHQDYWGMGNAVPDALAVKDVQLIKKMGGNFLRVAHYPQDLSVMAACDSLGIVTSVEIPVVNEISETKAFFDQCIQMQEEMVRQYYNHPSVVMWCYMNEVLLKTHYANDKERQKKYLNKIKELAEALDSVTRKEDPYRYTMIAHHGDYKKYKEAGLLDISMIIGWNLYSGWYGAKLTDFPAFLDDFHRNHPDKIMLVSEYGADADPRIISNTPVRFDKSVQYATKFHQYYIVEMLKRPFVAAAMIWNLADFNSETRNESMPHINNKGVLAWDRTPKDPYYYYQALLSKKKFVKILGVPFHNIKKPPSYFLLNEMQVVANTETVELFINGKSIGKKIPVDAMCVWNVSGMKGDSWVEVKATDNGKVYTDKVRVVFVAEEDSYQQMLQSGQVNMLLGADRYFKDPEQDWWIPAREYQQGNAGYIGGKAFKIPNGNRLPYGTDKNILQTWSDPIYQTQQVGIGKFRLDVPSGTYEIILHFAELLGGSVRELPYNLNDPERIEPKGKRVFDVYINDQLFLDRVDLTAQYGSATAVTKKIQLNVTNEKGIEISFKAIEGEPVLNAIQIKKLEPDQP